MNPRHRRLLIPGLLVALLVVVLVSSLVRRADGAESGPVVVSRISDPRVVESSGLAISLQHEDLAYTINDSGHAPVVYAVTVSTGAVVGATTIGGANLRDTEALSIDGDGRLWVADTGDNRDNRDDVALFALPEPGPGDRAVTAERYPVTYEGGPVDVEALLVDPRSGAKLLVTKELLRGRVLALPTKLSRDRPNRAEATATAPGFVTDGAMTPDGRHAVLRTYSTVHVHDARTWDEVATIPAPAQQQGESLAVERSGRSVLVGSEGAGSELVRLPLDLPANASPTPSTTATATSPRPAAPADEPLDGTPTGRLLGAGVVGAVVVLVLVAVTRRSRRR